MNANKMTAPPIVMIFLSRVLPQGVNRWANIIAAVIRRASSAMGTFRRITNLSFEAQNALV